MTCKHGHTRTPENTYIYPNGKRQCVGCRRASQRAYFARHREDLNIRRASHHAEHREERNAQQRERDARTKAACFIHYRNGALACSCCGEGTNEFLTLDHINGRKAMGHTRALSGPKLYRHLFTHNFPPGFDVLCMNCNLAKGIYGQCPHKQFNVFDLAAKLSL